MNVVEWIYWRVMSRRVNHGPYTAGRTGTGTVGTMGGCMLQKDEMIQQEMIERWETRPVCEQ